MKVIRNYLYNVSYQVLAIIVPLITSAYISRVLHPEGVGINAFTNSIIQYFILIANMGIGYYGNRQIAYVRENKFTLTKVFWEIQIVKTIMTLLAYIIFLLFLCVYTKQVDYMWAQSINLIAVAFDISWFYEGIEDFKVTVLKNSFVKLISMITIFLMVRSDQDVLLYIVILGLSTLIGNFTLWPNLKRNLVKINLYEIDPKKHFFPMITLFIPQIATQIYVQLNRTMVGVMVNETASGFYQYSDNLVKLVLALITATGTVMLPHISNAYIHKDYQQINGLLYKIFDFVSAIAFPCMFGLSGISLTLAPLYYGNGYAPVGQAMFIETIVILMIGWSNVIGMQYLLPLKKVKQFNISVTVGALTNIVLNFPLIYFWGLEGAMWSTVISETAVTIYQIIVIRNCVKLKELFQQIWKYFISGLIMFIIVFSMNRMLNSTWIMLFIEVLVGAGVYIVLIFVLRAPVIYNIVKLLNRIKNR